MALSVELCTDIGYRVLQNWRSRKLQAVQAKNLGRPAAFATVSRERFREISDRLEHRYQAEEGLKGEKSLVSVFYRRQGLERLARVNDVDVPLECL